jgi:superfamily I DNA and/or RNA helicase
LPTEREKAIEKIEQVLAIDLSSFLKLHDLHQRLDCYNKFFGRKKCNQSKLIDSIRVIGATCNHIAAKKYAKYNFEFDYVIMDESGKATTAEALVPIITGKNLIYVGDHRQLKPMLTAQEKLKVGS